ncbi:cuticle protein LPCP-23-like [Anoplophora glabripennis]|uniref:cuticle protein LPCP-23-like n=1 Tax=Anoplophora glabripennis TaxID=217634 RepID=UPI000873C28D|nr:cuticle protein LPCP-23-like [Anoplophora glabripennis]
MKSFVAFTFFALLAVANAGIIPGASSFVAPSAYAAPGVVAHGASFIPNASPFVAHGAPIAYGAHPYAHAGPLAYAGVPHGLYY